jgi:ATP-binding cassette, subfamily B, bacterial
MDKVRQNICRAWQLFDRPAWGYFAGYYRKHAWRLVVYALIASAQSLFVLPVLYLIRYAFDDAIPHGKIMVLLGIGAGILLVRAASSGVSLYLRMFILRVMRGAVFELRSDLLARIYGLSHEYFGGADLDQMATRIIQDSERVDNMSNALFSAMLPAFFTSVALIVVLLFLNWWMVAAAAAVLPLLWLSTSFTGGNVKHHVHIFQRAFEGFSTGVHFILRQMDLTRFKAFEDDELARQRSHLASLRYSGERMAMSYAVHGHVENTVMSLAGIVILIAGGTAIANGAMTLGQFLSFYVAAGLLNGQVDTLIGALPELITGNASLVKLRELGMGDSGEPYHGSSRPDFDGNVSIRNVTFAYGDHIVLRDLSLEIDRTSNVAIIGPNGAGKSTILKLIVGFCRPERGQLFAEDVPYDELDMRALRRSIGVVMQHPTFFSGTIYENIAYGARDYSRDEVIAASKRAFADDFIKALPKGYDTEIGHGGMLLSGGECQRLAIARALIGRPKLLILDEPNNHLDQESIERLMDELVRGPNPAAIVIISHDPEVVRFADKVYRLDGGVLWPVRVATTNALVQMR